MKLTTDSLKNILTLHNPHIQESIDGSIEFELLLGIEKILCIEHQSFNYILDVYNDNLSRGVDVYKSKVKALQLGVISLYYVSAYKKYYGGNEDE